MLNILEILSSAHSAVQRAMPAVVAVAEGIVSIAFLQRSIFHQAHVADACKTDLADHVLIDVNLFRCSILGWSRRHKVACAFCRFE